MDISMAGIDYTRASVEEREPFSLTKAKCVALARQLRDRCHLDGCLLLSTCNRTELWVSGARGQSPLSLLCDALSLSEKACAPLFLQRTGESAMRYLFHLACGMESQIFGEDQILGQIKEAADLARTHQTLDPVLEVLFRKAITSAKQVKTQVHLTRSSHSVAEGAVERIQRQIGSLRGIRCLVIGNGEMGKLAAQALLAAGGRVSMTLRAKGHHAHCSPPVFPPSCDIVDYDARVALLQKFPVVVSATASPHLTLRWEEVAPMLDDAPRVFLDLAMPRDIDSRLAALPSVTLLDLDDIPMKKDAQSSQALQQTQQILQRHWEELVQWDAFRSFSDTVQTIGKTVAKDTALRLKKPVQQTVAEKGKQQQLQERIQGASEKSVAKLLYGMKDTLPPSLWESCLHALAQAAQKFETKGEPL